MKQLSLIISILLSVMMLSTSAKDESKYQKIDSLKVILLQSNEDTSKVSTLNKLAYEYRAINYDSLFYFAKQSVVLAKQIEFGFGEAEAMLRIAYGYWKLGEPDSSIIFSINSIKILLESMKAADQQLKLKITFTMASAYNTIGLNFMGLGKYPDALKNYLIAIKLFNVINDKTLIDNTYNNIGIVYLEQGNFPESLKYHLMALKIREETADKWGLAYSYHNISTIYSSQNNYNNAIYNDSMALKLRLEINDKEGISSSYSSLGYIQYKNANYEDALKNYFKSMEIKKEINDKDGLVYLYNHIGLVHVEMGDFIQALTSYKIGLDMAGKIKDQSLISYSYHNIGNCFLKQHNYSKASDFLERALMIAKEMGNIEGVKMSFESMVTLDSLLGNYKKAWSDYKMVIAYRDSMFNEENTKKLVQSQMQYDFDKKETATKAEQDKKDALAVAEIKRQTLIRNSTFGGVGIASLFSFLLVFSFNRRRKTAFEKQVSEVEMKALRSQMNPHFIFNSLQSVKKYIMENAKNDAAEYLSKFSTLMRMILENSRKQEVTLEKDLSALQLYMELESLRFQNRFQFTIEVEPEIDREDTLIAPLLLQPFVENSIIHGISSKENGMIKVKVSKVDNMIKCTVEDNGIGRDQSVQVETGEKKKRESLGMKITQERLSIINRLKKVKTAITIFDLKDAENKPEGLRIELMLPFETAF